MGHKGLRNVMLSLNTRNAITLTMHLWTLFMRTEASFTYLNWHSVHTDGHVNKVNQTVCLSMSKFFKLLSTKVTRTAKKPLHTCTCTCTGKLHEHSNKLIFSTHQYFNLNLIAKKKKHTHTHALEQLYTCNTCIQSSWIEFRYSTKGVSVDHTNLQLNNWIFNENGVCNYL